MKSLTKILLAAALLSITGYTYAKPAITVHTKASEDTQDRYVTGFNAVDAQGSFDVYITQGATESVKVKASSDIINNIITEVVDGTLKIHSKHNSGINWGWSNHHKVIIYVSIKNVNAIGISGSGDVYFKEGLSAEHLNIRVSGSGDASGKVEVKTLDCNVSGSGNIKLNGRAEESNVSVSGSGDYSAKGLPTVNTTVQVAGSGDAGINASGSITAAVSGSGDVSYTGGAQHITKSKSGSGDISGD